MKKNFFEIKVMDYRKALDYVYCNSGNPKELKYAIISIQEPTHGYGLGLEFKKGGNCVAALNIEFDDCTPVIKFAGATLMTKQDAKLIHDFVESLPQTVEMLIVQCKCGQSRSVAVADALLNIKTGQKKDIYKEEESPNKYVYYNILEAYGMKNIYWDVWYNKEKEKYKNLFLDVPDELTSKLSSILEDLGY